MKTLVTGGTGFLGSHIVEALLAQGHEVRALARQTSDTSHLKTTSAELVYGDVEDYDSLPPAVEGVEIIFHAAGRVTPGWGKWQEFEGSIVKGTENVLRASAEAGVSRFLYVSSHTVYGKEVPSKGVEIVSGSEYSFC
ncbi:MAG: NAD-dependent epimerase/dehydratase family protein [Dehalococcoidia bacterium]|nr:NAD-dependent epimerase/dehydratase family protein [Dehalococcoidia bacterium]